MILCGVLIPNCSLKSATDNLKVLLIVCLVTLESTDNAMVDYTAVTLQIADNVRL